MLMFIRGSLTEARWSAALLLQPVEYSEGSSAVIKLQRERDWGPALPPLVFCPISGSWIVTSSFHMARKLHPVRWLKAWLPHVKNAAQVVGTYPSIQHFGQVRAIFWSYDKKDYSIFDKECVSFLWEKATYSWAVVSVLQLQRSKEQFNKSRQGNIPPAQ